MGGQIAGVHEGEGGIEDRGIEGVRGRLSVKWEDRLLEYLRERGDSRLRGIESDGEEGPL